MAALVELRFRRDTTVIRIAQPLHESVVIGIGLVFFLFEPVEDVFPFRVGLPLGEVAVGGGGLDFAAPHFFDGCQIALVDHRG